MEALQDEMSAQEQMTFISLEIAPLVLDLNGSQEFRARRLEDTGRVRRWPVLCLPPS